MAKGCDWMANRLRNKGFTSIQSTRQHFLKATHIGAAMPVLPPNLPPRFEGDRMGCWWESFSKICHDFVRMWRSDLECICAGIKRENEMTEVQIGAPFGVAATMVSLFGEITAPAAILLIAIGATAVGLLWWVKSKE